MYKSNYCSLSLFQVDNLDMRIGIHSGSVMCGVLGESQNKYSSQNIYRFKSISTYRCFWTKHLIFYSWKFHTFIIILHLRSSPIKSISSLINSFESSNPIDMNNMSINSQLVLTIETFQLKIVLKIEIFEDNPFAQEILKREWFALD